MKRDNTFRVIFWVVVLGISILINKNTFATHAQSADITYQCLGPNQFEISVSFYRDCAGVNAPNTITINTSSISCNQNFNTTLSRIPGTGADVTPVCVTAVTTCNGGTVPGVEEYIFRGTINLPLSCNDWTFSFSLCCRNNAINTINNPGGENIYVEAVVNNLDFICNNSPSFSNPPVSFPCVGQTSCFNHGAVDTDGDSLYYSLIAPATGPATAVTYLAGYSAQQPLTSTPALTFDPITGDICMTPALQEVTVLAVKVEEWRNEIFIGSVVRDIQLRTVVCNNNLPYLTGINGGGQYSINACAGSTLNFNIPSFDADAGQTISLNWNNAIPAASFTTNGAQLPAGNFVWTPTAADVSPNPYCFTATVSDDNCPMNGVQIYSFCITVNGFTTTTTSTPANCGASNGSASATVQGGIPPYTYQWMPNGGANANANGLLAGQYSLYVIDAVGCVSTSTVNVGTGPLPGNINITGNNVSCFGGNDGSLTANVNGGGQPYVYSWSTGGFNQTISNLTAGTYWVSVISNGGCVTTDTFTVTQPASPVTFITTQSNVTCFNGTNGTASVIPSGGTGPYTAVWNTNPAQNNINSTGLSNGTFMVTVTDNNGCNSSQNITITQPSPLNFNLVNQQNVSCFAGNDGGISINVYGGTSPYNYNWNNVNLPNSNNITNLSTGVYLLNLIDANGCVANNQYTITEPSQLTTSIINTNDISCYGLSDGAIQTNTIGGTPPYSYLWNSAMVTTSNINNLLAGNHIITVTDNNGCVDSISAIINEPTAIITSVQGGSTICPGEFAALITSTIGGTGNITYQWNNGNTGATQMVSPSSSTTYSVFATDANGCVGNVDSAIVLVNDINLVNLSTVPDTSMCEGSPYLISANISGGIGTYSFTWNNGLGQGQGPFVVAPLYNTIYTITVTDNCGNMIDESIVVNINPIPTVTLQPQSGLGCGAVNVSMVNSNFYPSGTSYFWDFDDGNYSSQENPDNTFTETGVYNVSLTITSVEGCINSDQTTVNVTVNPIPVAQFNFDPRETDVLNPQISFDNYSVDADYYSWFFDDGSTSNEFNPIHYYENDGTYFITLIASNSFGCADTVTEELIIEPAFNFYIPNAFTPDGNGNNEIFTAVGEEISEFEMQIFDRWGELIYETKNLEKGWDGSAKGGSEVSMEGVYVYRIRLTDWEGINHKFVGHVSLLK